MIKRLVGAIGPKIKGSSTTEVKKSTVCTNAVEGPIRYTPASSALSKPTSTFGSCCRANFPSTASSAAGASLLAQPAALAYSVNLICFSDIGPSLPSGFRLRAPAALAPANPLNVGVVGYPTLLLVH